MTYPHSYLICNIPVATINNDTSANTILTRGTQQARPVKSNVKLTHASKQSVKQRPWWRVLSSVGDSATTTYMSVGLVRATSSELLACSQVQVVLATPQSSTLPCKRTGALLATFSSCSSVWRRRHIKSGNNV